MALLNTSVDPTVAAEVDAMVQQAAEKPLQPAPKSSDNRGMIVAIVAAAIALCVVVYAVAK